MALIKCNECGHMISSNAQACPKCGCPVGYEMGKGDINDPTSTMAKSVRSKKSPGLTKEQKIAVSILVIIFLVAPFILIMIIECNLEKETPTESYTSSSSYGPGTYEFVDEAKQKWQLIIELETEGSEADYSLVEHKNCKLKNKSNGEEYKGFWYDDSSLYHKKGEQIAHYYKCFRIYFQFGSKTNYRCPIIFQKNAEFNDWFYLEDGYIYINSDQKEDTNGKGFGFEEAFINRDPRIRLPIKRIK